MRLDDDDDLDRTESRDLDMNRSKEIVAIMGTITPLCSRKDAVMKCKKLLTIFSLYPDIKDHLITHFGVTPILEMFEATQQNQLARGSAYNVRAHFHFSFCFACLVIAFDFDFGFDSVTFFALLLIANKNLSLLFTFDNLTSPHPTSYVSIY